MPGACGLWSSASTIVPKERRLLISFWIAAIHSGIGATYSCFCTHRVWRKHERRMNDHVHHVHSIALVREVRCLLVAQSLLLVLDGVESEVGRDVVAHHLELFWLALLLVTLVLDDVLSRLALVQKLGQVVL